MKRTRPPFLLVGCLVLVIGMVLIASVLTVLFIRGIITIPNNNNQQFGNSTTITDVSAYFNVNYTTVANINFTNSDIELKKSGYTDYIANPYNVYDYYLQWNGKNNSGDIWGRTFQNGTRIGEFYIVYGDGHNYTNFNINDLTAKKEAMKQEMVSAANQIAQICNIKLDWSGASIQYDITC